MLVARPRLGQRLAVFPSMENSKLGKLIWACGLQPATGKEEWWRIWRFKGPKWYGYTTWIAYHDLLVTKSLLFNRYYSDDPFFSMCGQSVEFVLHVLRVCPRIRSAWWKLVYSTQWHSFITRSFIHEWIDTCLSRSSMWVHLNLCYLIGICFFMFGFIGYGAEGMLRFSLMRK